MTQKEIDDLKCELHKEVRERKRVNSDQYYAKKNEIRVKLDEEYKAYQERKASLIRQKNQAWCDTQELKRQGLSVWSEQVTASVMKERELARKLQGCDDFHNNQVATLKCMVTTAYKKLEDLNRKVDEWFDKKLKQAINAEDAII